MMFPESTGTAARQRWQRAVVAPAAGVPCLGEGSKEADTAGFDYALVVID